MEKIVTKISPSVPPIPARLRVAAYARVSSGKDAMLQSLAAQVSYYSKLIQQRSDVFIYSYRPFLPDSRASIISSCGLPTKAVVQFCFTMSKISYQMRLACF
jgi:hypothetical protein